MTEPLSDLQQILAAVAIESPTRYTLNGAAHEVPPPGDGVAVSDIPLVTMAESESTQVTRSDGSSWLAVAADIGDALCRTAIWHGALCNWFGRSPAEMDEATRAITAAVESLEADLYGGSSGVGLFLAQLAHHTASDLHRRTAIAALRRSLAAAVRLPPAGLFSGQLGVAYAAGLGGLALGDPALCREALALARATADRPPAEDAALDVIGGLAGGIQALLALSRLDGGGDLVERAVVLASRLVDRAHHDGEAWIWAEAMSADGGEPQALTGMSHGAAGIGLALFEAHAATGDPVLRTAARGAFLHENTQFDPAQHNWRDLRPWVTESMGASTCGLTWCHGAPGMALARLRAHQLDPCEPTWRTDAETAVATTAATLDDLSAQTALDATLCHGTCGLLETLLASGTPEHRRRAELAASRISERIASGPIVTGVPSGGPNPSLMLGTAGVGWLFLRLFDPAVPSFLASPGAPP